MVFVRGPEQCEIQHFVEKVVFRLHDSFPNPNAEEPRKVCFTYDLFLNLEGNPPVNHLRCEKLTFNNPTFEFLCKLLRAGGVMVMPEGAETVSRPSPDYPMLPTIPLSAFSDPKKTKPSHGTKPQETLWPGAAGHSVLLIAKTACLSGIGRQASEILTCPISALQMGGATVLTCSVARGSPPAGPRPVSRALQRVSETQGAPSRIAVCQLREPVGRASFLLLVERPPISPAPDLKDVHGGFPGSTSEFSPGSPRSTRHLTANGSGVRALSLAASCWEWTGLRPAACSH
ncbi:uncharacterized protein ACIGJ3_018582 [Trichechus inunguis]